MAGRLEIVCGCMFAGKTTELIRRLDDAARNGAHVGAFKHAIDDRYAACELATHDGRRSAAVPVASAAELLERCRGMDVVGLDEAHFFGRALIEAVAQMVAQGKRVIAVGLDHDAWGRPFHPLPELKQMADEVLVMHTPCSVCGRAARFSQRMVPITTPTMVGGPGDYEPRCRDHFQPLPDPAPEV